MATVQKLRQKYLATLPELDSLLQLSCNKEKAFILAHPDYQLTVTQLVLFYCYFFQFRRGVPIAYLAKHKEFYGLEFKVNRHTLVPRPDTELMVEETLKILNNLPTETATLIDVGTGSGCIPIAILKHAKQTPEQTLAIDISAGALHIAKQNARLHDVNINFVHGDLLTPVADILKDWLNTKIITANLPYLTAEQFASEPSIQREPKSALVAGEQGLADYRQLLLQIKELAGTIHLLLEIDPSQTESIKELIQNILLTAEVEIKTDLAGRDRLVIIKFN